MEKKKIKFMTPFNCDRTRTPQDLSNQFEQTYIELEPYARKDNGEFLNDSPFPKLVPGEKVNIQERIQSYFEDVDIYSILKKVAATGDLSYLNRKEGFYGDISNLPDNYNDINEYYKSVASKFRNLPVDIQNLIKNGASDEAIAKALEAHDPTKTNNKNNLGGSGAKEPVAKAEEPAPNKTVENTVDNKGDSKQ